MVLNRMFLQPDLPSSKLIDSLGSFTFSNLVSSSAPSWFSYYTLTLYLFLLTIMADDRLVKELLKASRSEKHGWFWLISLFIYEFYRLYTAFYVFFLLSARNRSFSVPNYQTADPTQPLLEKQPVFLPYGLPQVQTQSQHQPQFQAQPPPSYGSIVPLCRETQYGIPLHPMFNAGMHQPMMSYAHAQAQAQMPPIIMNHGRYLI